MPPDLRQEVARLGFFVCKQALIEPHLTSLREKLFAYVSRSQSPSSAHAVRHVLTMLPDIRGLVSEAGMDRLASIALGDEAVLVDATFFDKTAEANWTVPTHQDVVMPAAATPESSDTFSRYGGLYTDAPDEVLHRILALRLHLDPCPADNGALDVVPGSHLRRLTAAEIAALPRESFTLCPAEAGDVMLMAPLLVHRSASAGVPRHRRVLHLLYRA